MLTTLHTNDAISAIPRLKDLCSDAGFISDALLGVVGQRLVRKICPHCCEPYTPTEADLKVLGLELRQANGKTWQRGQGCPKCFNCGSLGREAIVELLKVDRTVRQIIYEGSITQLHHYISQINFDSFRSLQLKR